MVGLCKKGKNAVPPWITRMMRNQMCRHSRGSSITAERSKHVVLNEAKRIEESIFVSNNFGARGGRRFLGSARNDMRSGSD